MNTVVEGRPIGQRKFGFVAKAMSLTVLGLGLVLGGCNNDLKKENEALRGESAEWKERATAAEMKAQQAEANAANAQSQVSNLQQQLAAKPAAQPAPMTDSQFVTPAGSGQYPQDRMTASSGRSNRSRSGGGERFTLAGDVSFPSGQAVLKPEARRELDGIAAKLKREHSSSEIRVEGHTDSDPVKKSKYGSNEALSKARADAVRDYLVKKGISRSRIETVGKGASEPKGSKADSRRVEIVVVD